MDEKSQEQLLPATEPLNPPWTRRLITIDCYNRIFATIIFCTLLSLAGVLNSYFQCTNDNNATACSNFIRVFIAPDDTDQVEMDDSDNTFHSVSSIPNDQRMAIDVGVFQLDPWTAGTENISNLGNNKLVLVYGDITFAGRGHDFFTGCPVPSCFVTTNKSLSDRADAILFYASYMIDTAQKTLDRLPRKHGDQVFVYVQGESPIHSIPGEGLATSHFFNWTMTYRLDSDIRGHYTYAVPLQKKAKNFAKGKDKLVVWFASHCNVHSKRDQYVRKLQQFIPVDIYGKCGNLTCDKAEHESKCRDIIRQYKFVLAFENSICRHYVTEKIVTAYDNDVVPVVMGDGDYEIFPEHSYIHAFDFASPSSLAKHLWHLANNDTAYNLYMRWRYNPRLTQSHGEFAVERNGYCELCKRLHDLNENVKEQRKSIASINHWWRGRKKDVCVGNWYTTPSVRHQLRLRQRSSNMDAYL
ncbi:glycoprotein 3-alpha-L-fucosyltransferase A-like [Paramacrobiotus metropolitanus]|uniref:glycoprotein 3-alpha-L-fucosyltransferase A-like n=1 Tax=Paramacrobiotus metropolitanus TaxID=2943436 RepID=UPI002445CF73|nr:glycoprotein 3-alpha-L-fucosyltransferase A-like [Paramacrobiotus metropolitanus]